MPHSHRSGSLKQTNKKHKGSSKRNAQVASGPGRVEGRSERSSIKSIKHDKDAARTGRIDRANQAKQRREQKRGAIWLQKRMGGGACAPRICLWVPLSPLADCRAVQEVLQKEAAGSNGDLVRAAQHDAEGSMTTMLLTQHKQRMTFVHAPSRDAMAILELAKVADIVMLVLPVQEGIEGAIDKVRATLNVAYDDDDSVLIAAAPSVSAVVVTTRSRLR